MHDIRPDPLNELLGPPPPPSSQELAALRERTWARTLRVLRRGRAGRRLGRAAILVGCYAAGLLTAWGLWSGPAEPPAGRVERGAWSVEGTNPPNEPRDSARVLEEQAREEEVKSELYRRAGDRYLAEADPEGAVRCYGNALTFGTEEGRVVSPEDSWLLMAIKHARQKENDDAPRFD